GLLTAQVNITPIRTDVTGFSTWTDTSVAGTTYLQLLVADANTVSPAMDFNSYTSETLNFKARSYGGTNTTENTITVSVSIDNGSTWSVLGTRLPASSTLTAMTAFDLSSYAGTQVKVKFSVAGTSNTIGAGIDDISITGIAGGGSATISVSPTTLTGFNYVTGNGPSTSQTFTVSGSNLTSNISIAATTNYEISLSSGSGYTTPITLNHSSGTVTATTIYARLKTGLAVDNYNSEIINITSTGATAGTVTCSGSVTATAPEGGYLVNFEGATETKTAYASGTVNLSGLNWNMTEALIGNSTSDFFTGTKSARFSGKATSSMTMLEDKTNGLGTLSFQYRRYGTEAQVAWMAEYSTNSGSSWTAAGSAFTATDVVQTFSAVINASANVRIRIKLVTDSGTATKRMNIDDISLSDYSGGTPAASITVNPETLSGFTYVTGSGPSSAQSFSISGANLTANISIAASTNYEISLSSGSGYTTPITLNHSSGTVAATTIYVRLKAGLASGTYNSELIVATSGTATSNVSCSGSVTATSAPAAPVATDATNVTDSSFSANWNAVSGATGYFLDAYTRSTPVVGELFISEYIEGSSFNKAIEVYNGTGSTVDLTQYSVRKQVNGAGAFMNDTPLTGTLASGEVFVLAHSTANAAILAQADLTLATSPLDFNGNDVVALYKNDVQIDVVGIVDQTTNWGADVTLVRNASATAPTTSYSLTDWTSYASDTTTYLGSHTRGRSITYLPGYQNFSVGNVLTTSVIDLNALSTYYYVVRSSNANGTSVDSNEKSVTTTAGATPPATPVATGATGVGMNSFTATWNAASGAESYRLDVSTSNSFGSFVTGYNNLTVTGISQAVSGLNANTPYYYRVRAYNTNGTSVSSNIITVTTLANDPFNGYYAPVAGLSGTALKTGLHNLIDNNTYSSYDGAKLELFQELDNNNGVVKCVYTGQEWTVNSSYDGSSNPNTEHTYAQSWFGSSEVSIKKADVHHLFVSNSNVNSSRGNLPFDVVNNTNTTYTSDPAYVSKRGTNAEGRTVFEPADPHKGNLARALLYFNVRYNMTLSQGGVDMLEQLIVWHNADPVDTAELTRNVNVLAHQGNRNPFVDHPEYVSSIWGGSASTTIVQFSPASAVVNEGDGSVTLNVQILNPSSTATTAQVILGSGDASDVNYYTTSYLTFPANSSSSQTVTVYLTDDSIQEGAETLVFSLQNVSGGNSAAIGSYGSFNLTIDDNDIPVPVAVAATNISATGFTANWNAVAGITDYEIDLSTSAAFASFVSGYEANLVTGTTLDITGLSSATTYYYRVRSFLNQGASASSNVIIAATLTPSTPSASVLLRPTQIDISAVDSESAVLVMVQSYPSDDAKYRLYNGGNNYNSWNPATSTYISSSSYSDGPSVPGTPSTSSTWWIPFQRGNNATTVASYRDRLGAAYSANYQTAVLPVATAITDAVPITMGQVSFNTWDTYTAKYVALAFDATAEGTLVSATSTALETGDFTLKVESGTTISRIEIRDLNNNLIEAVTGTWPQALNPEIVVAGEPNPLMNIAGSPSEEIGSYLLQGVDLTADIEIVAPEHFELSATGATPWTSTLSLPPAFDGE
ncbi:MAG: endonuclease, partial [Candidatus Cloacimonetes bacterium]|nr:endonuclease [Candidatus Cloacimonadota bacterium]